MAHLPFTVDTSRLRLVQFRLGIMRVEADNQRCNSEWTDTSRLCVFLMATNENSLQGPNQPLYLLNGGNMPCNIFHGDGIFDC